MADNFGRAALILGERWGKLNDNLSSHMAKFLKKNFLVNYLCPYVEEGDLEHAKESYGIEIIPPVPPHGESSSPNLNWLILHKSYFPTLEKIRNRDVRLVIGHAPYTAQAALNIRNEYFKTAAYVPLYDSYPADETLHEIEKRLVKCAEEASGAIFIGHQLEEQYEHLFYRHSIEIERRVFIPRPTNCSQRERQSVTSESKFFVFTYLPEQFINEKSPNFSLCALAMGKAADDFHAMMDTQLVWVVHTKSCLLSPSSDKIRNLLFAKAKSSYLKIQVHTNASSNDIFSSINICHLGLFCCLLSECYDYFSCAINAINLSLPLIICDSTNLSSFLKKGCAEFCEFHLTSLPTNCLTEDEYNSSATVLKKQIFKKLNQLFISTLPNAEMLKKSLLQSTNSGTIAHLHEELITWFFQQADKRKRNSISQDREQTHQFFSVRQDQINENKVAMEITVNEKGEKNIKIHRIALEEALVNELRMILDSILPAGAYVLGSPKSKCIQFLLIFISIAAIDETWELCQNGTIARSFERFCNIYLKEKFGYDKNVSLTALMNPKKYLHCRKLLMSGLNGLVRIGSQESINKESGFYVTSYCSPDLEPLDLASSIPNSPFWRSRQAATRQQLQQEWKSKQTHLQQFQDFSNKEKELHQEKQKKHGQKEEISTIKQQFLQGKNVILVLDLNNQLSNVDLYATQLKDDLCALLKGKVIVSAIEQNRDTNQMIVTCFMDVNSLTTMKFILDHKKGIIQMLHIRRVEVVNEEIKDLQPFSSDEFNTILTTLAIFEVQKTGRVIIKKRNIKDVLNLDPAFSNRIHEFQAYSKLFAQTHEKLTKYQDSRIKLKLVIEGVVGENKTLVNDRNAEKKQRNQLEKQRDELQAIIKANDQELEGKHEMLVASEVECEELNRKLMKMSSSYNELKVKVSEFEKDQARRLLNFEQQHVIEEVVAVHPGYQPTVTAVPTPEHGEEDATKEDDPLQAVFTFVAEELNSRDWKRLGRELGVRDGQLDEIESDHARLYEQKYQMLRKWRETKGRKVTYNNLIKALNTLDLRYLGDQIKKKIPPKEQAVPKPGAGGPMLPNQEQPRNEPQKKGQELSDDFLLDLSKDLGAKWEEVGYKLRMRQPDIQRAKDTHPRDITKQAQSLLIQWRQQTSGKLDKWKLLATALEKAGCIEIAEKHGLNPGPKNERVGKGSKKFQRKIYLKSNSSD